jgi:biotin carboxyl carrier protein
VTEPSVGRGAAGVAGDEPVGLHALTEEILPALIARLRASRLGELEVRSHGWRVRLRRDPGHASRHPTRPSTGEGGSSEAEDDVATGIARSPAVGYFSPAALLVVGQSVQAGDQLGSVDVLGISQEVTAPLGGIVSAVLAEAGQAVEYGQALAEIDPLGTDPAGEDLVEGEAAAAEPR